MKRLAGMQSIADFTPSFHSTSSQDPVPISQMDDWLKCKEVNVTVTESLGKPGEKGHKEGKVLPDQGDIGGPTSKQSVAWHIAQPPSPS